MLITPEGENMVVYNDHTMSPSPVNHISLPNKLAWCVQIEFPSGSLGFIYFVNTPCYIDKVS